MPEPAARCPQCSAPLPSGSPEGLCPACLLKRGLEPNTAGFTAASQAGPRWQPPQLSQLAAAFPELELLELIGRGGMGAVYKAREKHLDRIVALKILPPEIGRDPAFAQRFAREAQAMAKLNHPNIVTIYSFGQRGELFFFIMEYVDGLSLRRLLDSGQVSPKEALAIVPQICDALQFAHDRGIVHRDIKPENILLSRTGQVKIADFGLAKLVGNSTDESGTGARGTGVSPVGETTGHGQDTHATEAVMGTPDYMAPEQTEHPSQVDHRADIYSLGVVFYQMLTGELPVGRFEPPSRRVVIDVRLDEVVLRALEREPERRYQQASQVKTEVETIAATAPGGGTQASPAASPAGPRAGRAAHVVMGVAMYALAILALNAAVILPNPWRAPALMLAPFLILLGSLILLWRALQFHAVADGAAESHREKDSSAALSPEKTEQMEHARQAVKAPAIGLLFAAGISLAVLFAMIAVVAIFHRVPGVDIQPWVLAILIVALSPNIFVFFAAIRMLNLRGRIPAIVGSVLALLLSPGNVIGLPMGIWALVVLSRREVIDAFATNATQVRLGGGKRHRWAKNLLVLAIAIGLLTLVRMFVCEPYHAETDAAGPEIPHGSYVFVYKLAHTFQPGDIVIYRHDVKNMLGRVAQDGPTNGSLMIERRDQAPQAVAIADVVGLVVFNTRAEPPLSHSATQPESSQAPAAPPATQPASPREVVAAYLRIVKSDNPRAAWDLTTRSIGAGYSLDLINQASGFRPLHLLANDTQAMVLSDTAGRGSTFYAFLVKRGARWLINKCGIDLSGDALGMMRGFKENPGVTFDVIPDEIVGTWHFSCESVLVLNADGSGTVLYIGPEGRQGQKPKPLKWSVSGDTLTWHFPDHDQALHINWMGDETINTADYLFTREKPATQPADVSGSKSGTWSGELGTLPTEVTCYIIDRHMESYAAAKKRGLFLNSQVYGVGSNHQSHLAGLITFENQSDKPMAGEVLLANFDSNDMILEDATGEPVNVRWVDRGVDTKTGRYGAFWTPNAPIPPTGLHVIAFLNPKGRPLQMTGQTAKLKMSNFPGPASVENFFLVLPKGWTVVDSSAKWKTRKQIGDFEIYQWQDDVPANTNHVVDVRLKMGNPPSGEASAPPANPATQADKPTTAPAPAAPTSP